MSGLRRKPGFPSSRPKGLFITGTDTGVGKTFVASGLAYLFRERGIDVGVMKPVATGCSIRSGRRICADARRLSVSAGSRDEPALVTPYGLGSPLAPWIAAEQEGIRIELDRIDQAYRELSGRHEVTIIEGVGGLLAPLTSRETVADLVRRLAVPVLIVGANRIGTLNHTLLTIREAERAGLQVRGLILNQTGPRADLSSQTNAPALQTLTKVPVLANIPYLGGVKEGRGKSGRIRALAEHLDKGLHDLRIELTS